VLVDEVFQSFDQTIDRPVIVNLYERGISVNSLSKTYSVPGIRVGWVVSSEEIAEFFRKYRDYTMICAGVLDDFLATHVLKHKEQVLGRNRAIVQKNLAILVDWVAKEEKVSLVLPKQVSTSFIRLDIPEPPETFCLEPLKEKGVLLVPGERFD
jgi:aspartate/methionine/tyrosine aminotransferase